MAILTKPTIAMSHSIKATLYLVIFQTEKCMLLMSVLTLFNNFSAHVKKTVQIKYQGTMEESRGKDQDLNRLEFKDMYDCVPRVNYSSPHHHIKPTTFSKFQVTSG